MTELRYFGEVFGEKAHLDGLIFKFDTVDEQQRQTIATKLRGLLEKHVQLDANDSRRCFRVQVFRMDNQHLRAIVKFGIYGPYLKAIRQLPASLIAHVFEAHFKAYLGEVEDEDMEKYFSRVVWANGGRQPDLFGNKANPNSRKGDGRGLRIGDRNSDYHFVFYRRRGERLGLELRIRDKACWTRAAKVLDFATRAAADDNESWGTLYRVLMEAATREFVRDLRAKSMPLEIGTGLCTERSAHKLDPAEPFIFEVPSNDDGPTWTAVQLTF